MLGCANGREVGPLEGLTDGTKLGVDVGLVGVSVGSSEGPLGAAVAEYEGLIVGDKDMVVAFEVGLTVGLIVGCVVLKCKLFVNTTNPPPLKS